MRRYLLENIEIFYVSVRSMGAIMYSFAEADNPLISKKIRPTARILQTAPVVYQMDDGRLLRRLRTQRRQASPWVISGVFEAVAAVHHNG
ncbi:hypothetical protein J2W59_002180 [Pseudomonas fluorescens]|nr:hypothetical protein [Pseudomonas fluorescens]